MPALTPGNHHTTGNHCIVGNHIMGNHCMGNHCIVGNHIMGNHGGLPLRGVVIIGCGGMKFDPSIHHRRSIRLRGYDYTQAGACFVTICTQNRACLFGEIMDGGMRLNDAGKMIRVVWDEIPAHYPDADIDAFIAMPNHIHGIIAIVGAGPRACPDNGQPHQGQSLHCGQPPHHGQSLHCGQPRGVAPTGGLSLPDVVHRFKTMTTKRYADGVKHHGWPAFNGKLWQRNYWEHIIRNEADLERIRGYIVNNPRQWELDNLYPAKT